MPRAPGRAASGCRHRQGRSDETVTFIHRVRCVCARPPGGLRRAVARPLAPWGGSLDGRRRPDVPSVDPSDFRARLLTALAWAAGAFAVIAVLSPEAPRIFRIPSFDLGMSGATLCAAVGLLGFMAVFRVARGLDARNPTSEFRRSAAHAVPDSARAARPIRADTAMDFSSVGASSFAAKLAAHIKGSPWASR